MVDGPQEPVQGNQLVSDPFSHGNNRRQQKRLGSGSVSSPIPGVMEPESERKILKLQRVEGSGRSSTGRHLVRGQHIRVYSDNITTVAHLRHQGGYEIQQPGWPLKPNIFLGRKAPPLFDGNSPEGYGQSSGRFPKQEKHPAGRMDPKQNNLPETGRQVGPTGSGPISLRRKCSSGEILFTEPQRQVPGSGYLHPQVEVPSSLRLSASPNPCRNPEEDSGQSYPNHPSSSIMAKEELVLSDHGTGGRWTIHPTHGRLPSLAGPPTSPKPTRNEVGGLATEAQILRARGLSVAVIKTLQKSRKPVTIAIYYKIWKRFSSWCLPDLPDPEKPNISRILDFLQRGLELDLKPTTLKVQVSALSAMFDCDLANHRWIRRFMTSATRLHPKKLIAVPTWDLNVVLTGLTQSPFEPLSSSTSQLLTCKVAFLVAITSAR
ncbi:uncharacterized protein [Dendrobates tinctorius]|uniref:uncharacterized protein n=1 Tax=Dendrobates tinctorius TaxID=92724 RepID=UPI003CCA00C4